MSYIRQNMLTNIDSILRWDFQENVIIPFSGRSIILVGDLGQLPLVMGKPVYASKCLAK